MTGRDYLFVLAFLAAGFVLSRWVLPFFGVPTCMSGSCTLNRGPTAGGQAPASDEASPEGRFAQPPAPSGELHRQ